MEHTQGTWRVVKDRAFDSGKFEICVERTKENWGLTGIRVSSRFNGSGPQAGPRILVSDETAEANARRIVACVNACAGMPQDDVEELAEFGVMELTVYADDMRQQRDQLQSQLETERASLFAEIQRKQQLEQQVEQQVEELVGVLEAMLEEVAGCYCTTEAAARAVIQKVRGGE